MKIVHIHTGSDNESHIEIRDEIGTGDARMSSELEDAASIKFVHRPVGKSGYHNAPTRQYVLYLTARVEIGLGDGTSVVMNPGDVLRAEDVTGHGHTSNVLQGGICAFVSIPDGSL